MSHILLIKCGAKAITKVGQIEGMVTGINIRFDRIQYELTYLFNGEIKVTWFHEEEFDLSADDKIKVGFRTK